MQFLSRLLLVAFFTLLIVSNSTSILAHDDEHQELKNGITSEQKEFGLPGVASNVTRTIDVSMGDTMRFVPDKMQFLQGETVRLQFTNTGKLAHEFILGTSAEITLHAEMMRKFPDMQHADASSVRVEAGKAATIIWQFNRAGDFIYACLIPGHSEAGMKGVATVVAVKKGVELKGGQ